jgi:YD repeat-containing protein
MERIYKNSDGLEHQYAYNEFGQVVHIEDAKKIINGKEIKYFLFPDLTGELILKAEDSFKKRKHFSLKVKFLEYNGKKYHGDPSSESPQHYDAKLKIVKQGFFEWSHYKIYVKEVRIEKRFGNSHYRSDLIAQLLSGEEVFIEIIKTSKPSQVKEKYIIDNQLPTFKIYIDENGGFEFDRFEIIGNSEIESIERQIQELQSRIPKCEAESAKIRWSYNSEKERVGKELSRMEAEFSERIKREREIEESKSQPDAFAIRKKIAKRRESCYENIERIRSVQFNIRQSREKTKKIIERIRVSKSSKSEFYDVITFFESNNLSGTLILDSCTTISDLNLFVTNHLSVVKNNIGNKTYHPYFLRLNKVKQILTLK